MPIHLPALRERIGDIRILATHFLDTFASRHRRPARGFTAEAMARLEGYHWPGNIRELQNTIERAVLLCATDRIEVNDFPALAHQESAAANLTTTLRAEKRRRVEAALLQTDGNQAAAARELGMSRSNFARLVKTLGVRTSRRAA